VGTDVPDLLREKENKNPQRETVAPRCRLVMEANSGGSLGEEQDTPNNYDGAIEIGT
jgi:hypothetical protein